MQKPHHYLAVGGGAMLGATARYAISLLLVAPPDDFPLATLLINVSGSFLLGLLLAYLTEREVSNPTYRLFFGTGLLGAYTTFSTFSYEVVSLLRLDSYLLAASYVLASVLLGLLAAFAGLRLGERLGEAALPPERRRLRATVEEELPVEPDAEEM